MPPKSETNLGFRFLFKNETRKLLGYASETNLAERHMTLSETKSGTTFVKLLNKSETVR